MPIPILLLLALPASGKSELRRYLDHLDAVQREALGLGEILQLDDYPYVAMMRSISRSLAITEASPVFFASDDEPFADARDWLTLIHLINEDHVAMTAGFETPGEPGAWLLDRLDRARQAAGAPPVTDGLSTSAQEALARSCDEPAAAIAAELTRQTWSADATILIEFARGGPEDAGLPLPHPYGYRASLEALSPAILSQAAALYVRVTPDQSRAKNRERATPDGEGSILHHGVPEEVMRREYGTDDFVWLLATSDRPGTITIESGSDVHHLPAAVFDNRTDHTTFLRQDPADWPVESVAGLHAELTKALAELSP